MVLESSQLSGKTDRSPAPNPTRLNPIGIDAKPAVATQGRRPAGGDKNTSLTRTIPGSRPTRITQVDGNTASPSDLQLAVADATATADDGRIRWLAAAAGLAPLGQLAR